MIREITMMKKTYETELHLVLNIDGKGDCSIDTGIGFFDHMIETLVYHSKINLDLSCQGDTHIDDHHTIEDAGIVLGSAILKSMGDKIDLQGYATEFVAEHESLAMASINLSGAGELIFDCDFKSEKLGTMSTQMIKEFFKAIAINSKMTIHIKVPYGENDHHKAEAIFKAFGRALRKALTIDKKK